MGGVFVCVCLCVALCENWRMVVEDLGLVVWDVVVCVFVVLNNWSINNNANENNQPRYIKKMGETLLVVFRLVVGRVDGCFRLSLKVFLQCGWTCV